MRSPLEPPNGWGGEDLSGYLEDAHRNRFATFANMRKQFDRLIGIDTLLKDLLADAKDPPHPVPILFMVRAMSAFRVACQNATGGQVLETFVSARGCLEFAGYAIMILEKPDRALVWFDRHSGPKERQKVRDEFTVGAVKRAIASYVPKLADIYSELYETAIDFGAHPNVRGFSASTRMAKVEKAQEISQVLLHGPGIQLEYALRFASQTGLMVCELGSLVLPERAASVDYLKRFFTVSRDF